MERGSARRSSLKGREGHRQSDEHWKDTFIGCGLELEVGGLAALQAHLYMKCLETIHEAFFCLLSLSHLFNNCACLSAC